MFHIIRAFHVAGRCTDCGECSRVCPQGNSTASFKPQDDQRYR
ncbi:MAG: 4Fe-4S binding protein [Clostridium sp.]